MRKLLLFLLPFFTVWCTAVRADVGDVVINEIHYNADPGNAGGEFLEIANHGVTSVDIGNWVVDQAVSFVFPSGTTLEAGEYIVLANNAETAAVFYGTSIFGEYLGRLANGGDTILLKDAALSIVDLVQYDDDAPWPTEADGGGPSIELIDLELDNNDFSTWGLGQPYSPGAPNTPTSGGSVGDVAITEIMYKPRREEDREKFGGLTGGFYREEGDDEFGEYVEIVNVTGSTINLDGWSFTDGIDYTFGSVSISPGQMLLIAADPGVMEARSGQPALGPFTGTLANGGERVTLRDSADVLVDTVRYNDKPPWPVAPDQFGVSLEVIDASRDNSTAANWRASTASFDGSGGTPGAHTFVEHGDTWRYRKGTSPFPVGWTTLGFNDSSWLSGRTGIGYDDGDDRTVLNDMQNGYISFAARRTFHVSQSQFDGIGELRLEINYDDAFVAHLNGVEVARSSNLSSAPTSVPYNRAAGNPGHEAGSFESFSIDRSALNAGSGAAGDNVLAVQIHNREIDSSDASMIPRLISRPGGGSPEDLVGGGTPGTSNSVDAEGLPPFVASLRHSPLQPTAAQPVYITAFISSDSPLTSVEIEYTRNTLTSISRVMMFDDGTHGDGAADDGFWSGQLPARPSPTYVNYRVRAIDSTGRETVYPYDDEPSETQAYLSFDNNVSTTLPIYHLYIRSRDESALTANPYNDRYVNAHLAIDGVTYPNIDVRLRGQGSRTTAKRQWKFRFNRHQLYDGNRTLDTMSNLPFIQWFAFEMFDQANIANLGHDMIRVYKNGSFFGVYVIFESPNSSWVRKRGLPQSTEVYKARTINPTKNTDLYRHQIITDWDFWGAWNKKLRSLEPPDHIRELTAALNDMPSSQLLPWLDQNFNIDEWYTRWILNILMAIDDFTSHNYYAIRPGDGGKWSMLGYDYCSLARNITDMPPLYGDGTIGSPTWQHNRFYELVSRDRTLKRLYALKVRQVLNDWNLRDVFRFMDQHFNRIARDRSLDNSRWGSYWRNSMSSTKSLLSRQRSRMVSFVTSERLPPASRVPVISPEGGPHDGPAEVTLTVTSGWTAYYTTDGGDPRLSTTRQIYNGPFLLEEPATVRSAAISGSLGGADWTDISQVTYEVPENRAPVVEDQDFATDDPIAITLNYDDPDGPGPYVFSINDPAGGSLSGAPPNLTYTPDPGTGFDSFTWLVNDGVVDSEFATVTIDIISVNVAPVGTDQSVATTEGASVGVTLDFVDPDGPGPFTHSINQPGSGEVSGAPPFLTFTPALGFSGEMTFSWTVNDGIDNSEAATVTISVADNQLPVVEAQNLATGEGDPVVVTLSFTDADGPGPYVYNVTDPENGTLSGTAPTLTYTPDSDFTGQDSFSYSVNDGVDESFPATITISVAENAPPLAQSKSAATRENEPLEIRLSYTDPDGPGPYQYNVDTPSNGSVSGTPPVVTYTPDDGFSGEDSFTYSVHDGLDQSLSATVTISVTESNNPPVPQSVTVTTDQGEPVGFALSFVDSDGPGPYKYVRTDPSNGTISGAMPDLIYRPNSGFFGRDSFTYRVNDGLDFSTSSATVTVDVERSVGAICYCDDDVGLAFSANNVGTGAANYSGAIGVGVFDASCGSEDCAASGTHEVRGPSREKVEDHIYVNIVSQIPSNRDQIAGWSLSIVFDDNGTDSTLTAATTDGTAGCDVDDCPGVGILDGGFAQTEVVRPNRNGGQQGAVSAVVTTFGRDLITLPGGQTTVLDLTFEVTVPEAATNSPVATLLLEDGLRGAGLPVNNLATIGSAEIAYGNASTVRADVVATVGTSGRFIRADFNASGLIEPLTDPVFLLRWLFRDGETPPCLAACDFNGDGNLQINDPIALLIWGFRGGGDAVRPFPSCGPSTLATDDELGCETPPAVCR